MTTRTSASDRKLLLRGQLEIDRRNNQFLIILAAFGWSALALVLYWINNPS